MRLPSDAKEYLAQIAQDTPFLAVVALNLIGRGELTSLRLDEGLREQVLGRYQDTLVAPVEGLDASQSRKILAAVAAAGSISLEDSSARSAITELVGTSVESLLRAVEEFSSRGVLVRDGDAIRVVPDILADQLLEQQAVIAGIDTGFVSSVWTALNPYARDALIVNLSALEWRLALRGMPAVATSVWQSLQDQVSVASWAELRQLAELMESLAYTEGGRTVELCHAVLARLDELDRADSQPSPSDAELQRAHWGLPQLSRVDVEYKLARPIALAAIQSDSELTAALEILWDLRIRDNRAPNQHPESAARMLVDTVADIGRMRQSATAEAIATWTLQAAASGKSSSSESVLQILEPLLKKEGYKSVSYDQKSITMEPYFMVPSWARPHRDAIRSGLEGMWGELNALDQATAVSVLGQGLGPPRGFFGAEVLDSQVVSWEDDDLATVSLLARIAERTSSSIIRQLVRGAVKWEARRARSMAVRYAALRLVNTIDSRDEALAELLVRQPFELDEVSVAPADFEAFLSSPLAGEPIERDTEAWIAEHQGRRGARMAAVTERLFAEPVADAARSIVDLVHDALAALQDPTSQLEELAYYLRSSDPNRGAQLARELATLELPSPVSRLFEVVIAAWKETDLESLVGWLDQLGTLPAQTRRSIGRAFELFDWAAEPGLAQFREEGLADEDIDVRSAFALSLAGDIASAPNSTLIRLAGLDVYPMARVAAIERASRSKQTAWPAAVDEHGMRAILECCSEAGKASYATARLVKRLALAHREIVSQWAASLPEESSLLRDDAIRDAIASDATALSNMLIEASDPDADSALRGRVTTLLWSGVSLELTRALSTRLVELDDLRVRQLALMLSLSGGDRHVWVAQDQAFANQLLDRAAEFGEGPLEGVTEILASAMMPMIIDLGEAGRVETEQLISELETMRESTDAERMRAIVNLAIANARSIQRRIQIGDDDDE